MSDRYLEHFDKYNDEKYCLAAVKKDGYALGYIHNQTDKICLAAAKENGYALPYVHNQTDKICLAAVKEDAGALGFIHDRHRLIWCMTKLGLI